MRVADEALVAVREHIRATYGEASLPAEPRRYKSEEGRAGRARGDPADDAGAAARGRRAATSSPTS